MKLKYIIPLFSSEFQLDGWVQDCSNFIVNALELLQSFVKPATKIKCKFNLSFSSTMTEEAPPVNGDVKEVKEEKEELPPGTVAGLHITTIFLLARISQVYSLQTWLFTIWKKTFPKSSCPRCLALSGLSLWMHCFELIVADCRPKNWAGPVKFAPG